jgi:hypothetical protein
MRLVDLTERNQQKTSLMYHGTSDIYLRSILKQGLLATPPDRTYDGEYGNEGYETYGGVYLTADHRTAEDAAEHAVDAGGGNPIIITVQYVHGSGHPDEDIITHIINHTVYHDFNDADFDYEKYESFTDFAHDNMKAVVESMVSSSTDILMTRGKLGKPVTPALYKIFELILNVVDDDSIEVYDIMGVVQSYPVYKECIEVIMQNMTMNQHGNTQVLRNIGFKGKTRIIQIDNEYETIWEA